MDPSSGAKVTSKASFDVRQQQTAAWKPREQTSSARFDSASNAPAIAPAISSANRLEVKEASLATRDGEDAHDAVFIAAPIVASEGDGVKASAEALRARPSLSGSVQVSSGRLGAS